MFQLYKQITKKMQTFFKRLIKIIDYQGFKNLNDFALNGLKYDSSSKLNRLKDEKNKPSVEILVDIANKFQKINIHWLVTGKGEMILSDNKDSINYVEEPAEKVYSKSEDGILFKENYNLLQQQTKMQEEIINFLKEKIEITEEKLKTCETEKKILAISKNIH